MLEILFTNRWRETFPGAMIGLLAVENVDNSAPAAPLELHKRALTTRLRRRYAGFDRAALNELPVLAAYKRYYRRLDSTYHVLLQLESILFKGRELPKVSPLVDAAFAAELETLILTASHDLDRLDGPITFDASSGSELFSPMNGSDRTLKANDMVMRDRSGVVCTVIYGQDRHSPVTPATRRALYVCYVPAGIEAAIVEQHLETIQGNIRLFAPDAIFPHHKVHNG